MIDKFSECTARMMSLMRDLTDNQMEQFAALEESRKVAQDNNTELIKANMEMQAMTRNNREDHREQLKSYKAELHSAKDRCNKLEEKHESLQKKYDDLLEKYIRLSEGMLHNGASTEVKINNK